MAKHGTLKRGAFAALAVLAFFALLETALWLTGGIQSRWKTPTVYTTTGTSLPRSLLCVGDSVTFGLGADTVDSYPSQLARHPVIRSRGLQVINLGKAGQTTRDAVSRLGKYIEQKGVSEGVVVLLGGFNDCVYLPTLTETRSHPKPLEVAREVRPVRDLLARTRTYRLLAQLIARARPEPAGTDTPPLAVGMGYDREICRGHLAQEGLAKAIRIVRKHGLGLVVTTYPVPLESPHSRLPEVTEIVNELWREEAQKQNVALLDIEGCVQEAERASDVPFFNDDGIHLFAEGYGAMAECLANELGKVLSMTGTPGTPADHPRRASHPAHTRTGEMRRAPRDPR